MRIIFRYILKKWDMRVWTEFTWLRIKVITCRGEHDNEHLVFLKDGDIFDKLSEN
jgi:hypothetical protein